MVEEKPKLRNIEAFPLEASGQRLICLRDPSNYSERTLLLPYNTFFLISLMDGKNSLLDLQAEYMRRYGQLIYQENIRQLLGQLDECLLLDSQRFRDFKQKVEEDFKAAPVRPALHAGKSYEASREKLAQQIRNLFLSSQGPGLPEGRKEGASMKGAILPHMDYQRGGSCYAFGYKEMVERSQPQLFIILGTCHGEMNGEFAATLKDFDTPFGILKTDKELVEKLARAYGRDLFAGEMAHRAEHSIELQAVLIKYFFAKEKELRLVPILCSGFLEALRQRKLPQEVAEISDFISALKETLSSYKGDALVVASGDLSHIGPRFGDSSQVTEGGLILVRHQDMQEINLLERLDADALFERVASAGNERKVCGWPSFYVLLKVIEAKEGKLLNYSQWLDPQGTVTFASMAFY